MVLQVKDRKLKANNKTHNRKKKLMAGAVAENILLIKVATPVNLLTNQPMAEFSAL